MNELTPALPKKNNYFAKIFLLIFVLMLSGMTAYIILGNTYPKVPTVLINRPPDNDPKKRIIKVGKEYIYQKDINYEIDNYPPEKDIDLDKLLKEKLIDDSIIIQEGQKEGYIKLDENTFNSVDKNYERRVFLVEKVKNKIRAESNGIMGTVVTIWFFNNDEETSIGYQNAKKLAYSKISNLHQAVKNKSMTIHEAADAIKKDTSLVDADPQYALNAYFDFRVTKGMQITHDPLLDKALWELSINEVTDIYTGYSGPGNTGKQANYHFGTVNKKISSDKNNFHDWLENVKSTYEIKYL